MSLENIQILLKESMGLNPDSIGIKTIKRDIDARMNFHGMNDYGRYLEYLKQEPQEIKNLIEEVIIPETWFLRDKKPFEALASFVKNEWGKNEQLNILSLPCSTGEEPYSIAITLLQNGLSSSDFSITAIDISLDNIIQAVQGRYTENSFRGTDDIFKDTYFSLSDGYFHLNEDIKNTVTFKNQNLFELDILEHNSHYHVIFCRNLLIYFDRDTQDMAISILGNMLKKNGILFAGHAESTPYMKSWEASKKFANSYAFRKFNDADGDNKTPRKVSRPATNKGLSSTRQTAPANNENVKPFKLAPAIHTGNVAITTSNVTFDADKALSLANEGRLGDAARLSEEYVSNHGPDVEAFMVLALVRNATGNQEDAMDYLRKVIYLEPDHYDALVHLALLAEQTGKTEEANILKKRAERIKIKHKKYLTGV